MYKLGHHLYEWDERIRRRLILTAKALIDLYGSTEVIVCVKTLVPDSVKRKEKLIKEIERQLVERPIKSWNRGVCKEVR